MPHEKNDYDILHLSPEATIEDVKAAFRKLARQYHPDLHPDNPRAEEEFRRICEAYEALSERLQPSPGDRNPRAQKSPLQAYDFYVRGAKKTIEKDYPSAIDCYTQALQLNPQFTEAYLKRAEVRHKLGDDRGVLEDCRLALEIDPKDGEAYYYQGRARYRLGYPQSAIDAYDRALAVEPHRAQTYYHRGIAYHDLDNEAAAAQSWQTAAELFQAQGDTSGYHLARDTLKRLQQSRLARLGNWVRGVGRLLGVVLWGFWEVAKNPSGGLLSVYGGLNEVEAVAVGLVFAAIANGFFVTGVYLRWRAWFPFNLFDGILVGCVPFVTLAILCAIARFCFQRRGRWAGDIFLAGTTLLFFGFLPLISGFSPQLGFPVSLALTVFACCYTILVLHSGCTQIVHLSETAAAIATPVMLLLSGWLTYETFAALFL